MSHFCPLPTITQKMKILKKWRNPLEISSFYTSAPKVMIICYTVPKIWCGRDVTIFHFRLFFLLLPKKLLDMAWAIFCPVTLAPTPKQPKKSKLKNKTKNKKRKNKDKRMPGDIMILHVFTKNYDQMMYSFWDMVHDRRTDRPTGGWTEKVKYRVGCPT